MALIGKTVTTGASQALASLCGTGGEAEGPGHSAGETDTGADGPTSICIICCANELDGIPKVPWEICLLGRVDGYNLS